MSTRDKMLFCQILSSLFLPPDRDMVQQLGGQLYAFLEAQIRSWGEDPGILNGFPAQDSPEMLLKDLEEEYDRLFSDTGTERVPLVESFYKPWTSDPHCLLPFAAEKGFVMGDSAIHLSTLYQHCGLEAAEPLRGMPDHLILELEFLAYLYQGAGDREVKMFIEHHLDWIPSLKENCARVHAHPVYRSLIDILDLFIRTEKERMEKSCYGEKTVRSEIV